MGGLGKFWECFGRKQNAKKNKNTYLRLGGGEYFVTPTGKSFRFVRARERAGGRARSIPVT